MEKKRNRKTGFEDKLNAPIELHLDPVTGDIEKLLLEEQKLVRHEYASRYLQNIGVEPTAKNMRFLLKNKPFSTCRLERGIAQGQIDAGEVINIYPNPHSVKTLAVVSHRHEKVSKNAEVEKAFASKLAKFEELYEMAKANTGLEGGGKEAGDEPLPAQQDTPMPNTNPSQNQPGNGYLPTLKVESKFDPSLLDFNFDTLKQKYLEDGSLSSTQTKRLRRATSKGIYSEKKDALSIYDFDFSQFRLDKPIIKELQASFDFNSADLRKVNDHFLREFPFMRIPIANIQKLIDEKKISEYLDTYGEDKKRFNEKKYIDIQMNHSYALAKFELLDIALMREILTSEEVTKIQGLLLHLSHWIIFGQMSLIPLDLIKRKQMLVMIMSYFSNIENEVKVRVKKRAGGQENRLWSKLVCPILIVNFKMMAEYFYLKKFPNFFKDTKAKSETMRLLFGLITEIFDPSGLNSKLLFWQDSVFFFLCQTTSQPSKKQRSMVKTKMYQVSPAVEYLYSRPADVQTRKIISTNKKMNGKLF